MSEVLERFLKYANYDTQSNSRSETFPSTLRQLILAEILAGELTKEGAKDVTVSKGYVYAAVPASKGAENGKPIAFIAHMDTSEECPGKNIRPRIIREYDGGDILLNEKTNCWSRVADFPELKRFQGKTLVVTDGTTLLGADDKAGIAAILQAVADWKKPDGPRHPKIQIIFTPDEEIGRGVEQIEMDRIFAAGGYTVDGADADELSYENFNAASADVSFHGVAVHPGEAKGIMKNASLLAMEFAGKFPSHEIPAETSGREGFYHLTEMSGNVSEAELHYILRDHDSKLLEKKKANMRRAAAELNRRYGKGTVKIRIKNSYRNMAEKILPDNAWLLECAREAIRAEGMIPDESPIRGGTDGATLSFMGLPCPNLGAGGMYFHGVHEVLCVESLEKCVKVLEGIAERMSGEG